MWKYIDYETELYHHGVKGMKWGIRKDRAPSGRSIYSDAKKKEPKITRDVVESIRRNGGESYGLKNRLKTEKSISRKIKLGKDIKDAIRYTAILNDKSFVRDYNGIKKDLKARGYTEIRCKNYFEEYRKGKVKHKSVQCNYQDRNGYIFEIQFQTRASQKAKDLKVPIYEEARNPKTTPRRKRYLESKMVSLAEQVKDPPGIDKIKSY